MIAPRGPGGGRSPRPCPRLSRSRLAWEKRADMPDARCFSASSGCQVKPHGQNTELDPPKMTLISVETREAHLLGLDDWVTGACSRAPDFGRLSAVPQRRPKSFAR
eukprot:1883821-Pyramimonas_sp.AAC.1